MLNGTIAGETRLIAEHQSEYNNLSIRDEQTDNGNVMVSEWYFTPTELLRLLKGAPVQLKIIGNRHPPVMLEVGEALPLNKNNEK